MLTRHYLYFSGRSSAEQAAAALPAGLKAHIQPGALGPDWLLLAEHDVGEPAERDRVERLLREIADAHGGEYDGHETRVSGA